MRVLQTEEDNGKHNKFVLSMVKLVFLKSSLWILSNLSCGTTELFLKQIPENKYQCRPLKTLVYQPSQKIKVLV